MFFLLENILTDDGENPFNDEEPSVSEGFDLFFDCMGTGVEPAEAGCLEWQLSERGASERPRRGQAECELREHERLTSTPTASTTYRKRTTVNWWWFANGQKDLPH